MPYRANYDQTAFLGVYESADPTSLAQGFLAKDSNGGFRRKGSWSPRSGQAQTQANGVGSAILAVREVGCRDGTRAVLVADAGGSIRMIPALYPARGGFAPVIG